MRVLLATNPANNPITNTVPAVVLAGGKAKPALAELMGHDSRALFVYNGETLLERVVRSLSETESVSEVTVIGEVPDSEHYRHFPDTNDFVMNVFAGAETYHDAPYLLFITSDLPFITGEAVAAFVTASLQCAEKTNASLVYPFVSVEECDRRFPGMKRTALKIAGGVFTGGNAMLVRPAMLLKQRDRIADAYAARKSPLRLAFMLGIGTVIRLLLSQKLSPRLLTQAFLEERVSRLLGANARGVLLHAPELAADLDKPEDLKALKAKETA